MKGGIRFCHPNTIIHLYKTLAVPTLLYGLELCDLGKSRLQKLDVEGRKGLKHLFNLSKYCRNYLNDVFEVDHVSTTIIKNKVKLFTRLLQNTDIREVILSIVQDEIPYPSFVQSVVNMSREFDFSFFNLLINNMYPKLVSYHEPTPEVIKSVLKECTRFWEMKDARMLFSSILEENVPINIRAT